MLKIFASDVVSDKLSMSYCWIMTNALRSRKAVNKKYFVCGYFFIQKNIKAKIVNNENHPNKSSILLIEFYHKFFDQITL